MEGQGKILITLISLTLISLTLILFNLNLVNLNLVKIYISGPFASKIWTLFLVPWKYKPLEMKSIVLVHKGFISSK